MRNALLVVVLMGNIAAAQTTFPVTVHVTDQTGAFVPSAAVSASDATGKNPVVEKTDGRGTAVLQLAAGACTVEARAPGFHTAQKQISISGPMTVPLLLRPGEIGNHPLVINVPPNIPTETLPSDVFISPEPLMQCRCTHTARLAPPRRSLP